MKFKLIAGTHYEGNRPDVRTYRAGSVIESDTDLVATYANKFERVDDKTLTTAEKLAKKAVVPQPVGPTLAEADARTAKAAAAKAEPAPVVEDDKIEGKDVTASFPKAENNDLTVIKDDEGHHVMDGAEVVSDKPLKTKKQVEAFLDSHLTEK